MDLTKISDPNDWQGPVFKVNEYYLGFLAKKFSNNMVYQRGMKLISLKCEAKNTQLMIYPFKEIPPRLFDVGRLTTDFHYL